MDFYTITASAADLNESATDYRLLATIRSGVHLNPNKSEKITFSEDDLIIVLSEG